MKSVNLPGLLIEYLVIGSAALIWIALLSSAIDINSAKGRSL